MQSSSPWVHPGRPVSLDTHKLLPTNVFTKLPLYQELSTLGKFGKLSEAVSPRRPGHGIHSNTELFLHSKGKKDSLGFTLPTAAHLSETQGPTQLFSSSAGSESPRWSGTATQTPFPCKAGFPHHHTALCGTLNAGPGSVSELLTICKM